MHASESSYLLFVLFQVMRAFYQIMPTVVRMNMSNTRAVNPVAVSLSTTAPRSASRTSSRAVSLILKILTVD